MKQLELRFYDRKEIAEVLDINPTGNNFAREVKRTLDKYCYQYEYINRRGVIIRSLPTTAAQRLQVLLVENYNFDMRIGVIPYAIFIYLLATDNEFQSMPWKKRATYIFEKYNIEVTDRTLSSWCQRLIKTNTVMPGSDKTKTTWMTEIIEDENDIGRKVQTKIDDIPRLMKEATQYFKRRSELLEEYKDEEKRWELTMKDLWLEYQCCYYRCKTFMVSAFDDYCVLSDLIDLIQEVLDVDFVESKPYINDNKISNGGFVF